MRERLETLIEAPYEELHVATFHAFCARLLQEEALEAGVDPFLSPVTPADRLALLLDRIDDLTLRRHEIRGNPAPLLASFVARIDRLKDELVVGRGATGATPSAAGARRGGRRRRARRTPRRELEFARRLRRPRPPAGRARRARLRRPDRCAPSGCCTSARTCASAWPQRFRHVLVDEYQDTNFAQGMLLRLLVEEHRERDRRGRRRPGRSTASAGASQKNLLDFERELPGRRRSCASSATTAPGRRILDAAARRGGADRRTGSTRS